MLKEKISADFITALKSKNLLAKNLLNFIKGEIQTAEKNNGVENLSDVDVLKIITKLHKSTKDTLEQVENPELAEELVLLEGYLPKQLTVTEIEAKMPELVAKTGATSTRDTGKIIVELQKDFPGQFNGKDVSTSLNKYFSQQ